MAGFGDMLRNASATVGSRMGDALDTMKSKAADTLRGRAAGYETVNDYSAASNAATPAGSGSTAPSTAVKPWNAVEGQQFTPGGQGVRAAAAQPGATMGGPGNLADEYQARTDEFQTRPKAPSGPEAPPPEGGGLRGKVGRFGGGAARLLGAGALAAGSIAVARDAAANGNTALDSELVGEGKPGLRGAVGPITAAIAGAGRRALNVAVPDFIMERAGDKTFGALNDVKNGEMIGTSDRKYGAVQRSEAPDEASAAQRSQMPQAETVAQQGDMRPGATATADGVRTTNQGLRTPDEMISGNAVPASGEGAIKVGNHPAISVRSSPVQSGGQLDRHNPLDPRWVEAVGGEQPAAGGQPGGDPYAGKTNRQKQRTFENNLQLDERKMARYSAQHTIQNEQRDEAQKEIERRATTVDTSVVGKPVNRTDPGEVAKMNEQYNYTLRKQKEDLGGGPGTLAETTPEQRVALHTLYDFNKQAETAKSGLGDWMRNYFGQSSTSRDMRANLPKYVYRDDAGYMVMRTNSGRNVRVADVMGGKFNLTAPNDPIERQYADYIRNAPLRNPDGSEIKK